jgi:tRNA-dihydrouridine synthase B
MIMTTTRIQGLPMIYLAPLQGMTDRIYRNLFPVYFKGVDLAIAPFISSSKKMKPTNNLLREFYPDRNTGIPSIPQIMSSAPVDFAKLANALYDIGYGTVNWNLGCPFPMVVKKGRGAGLLCCPDSVEYFLEKAMPALKPKLSIKLRIGLKYPDEVLQLIPIFNRYPIAELIIHPRTALQMYEGEVDLDIFEQCLNLSQHGVVYNGDIDSSGKLEMLSKRFGSINRWMIGRGLLGNPFLAEEIKFRAEKPYDEKIRILRVFHDQLFAEYSTILSGPAHITNKMKEVWTYMGSFIENREKIRKRINKTHHRDQYVDVVNKIFDELV